MVLGLLVFMLLLVVVGCCSGLHSQDLHLLLQPVSDARCAYAHLLHGLGG
jgi:hypothetical protein